MRLEQHGDIISSLGGRTIVTIAIAEKAIAANIARARRATTARMAAGKPIDTTEARERGLLQ